MPSPHSLRPALPAFLLLLISAAAPTPPAAQVAPSSHAPPALPAPPAYELDQLVSFDNAGGWLTATFHVPEELCRGEPVPVRIAGSSARWTIQAPSRTAPASAAGQPPAIRQRPVRELTCTEGDDESAVGYARVTLHLADGYLAISATLHAPGRQASILYRARDADRMVHLSIHLEDKPDGPGADAAGDRDRHADGAAGDLGRGFDAGGQTLLSTSAPSLCELWAAHRPEVEAYLAPVLRKVARRNLCGPGAADVYAAFGSIAPSAPAARRVAQLLPFLDAPDAATRERASRELARLGRDGVLAALRLDRAVLSPEQVARLDALVNPHRFRAALAPHHGPRRADFLLECLEDDDPRVRAEAARELAGATGLKLRFDPADADVERRADAARTARALVESAEPRASR